MKRALLAAALLALPAAADATDWTLEAGAGVVNEPSHLGARSRQWFAIPVISATYGSRLQASVDDGIRWQAIRLGPLAVGPVVEYRFSYDRDLPVGFRTIRDSIEPGGFAALTTPVGILEGRVRTAVTGYAGWSADVAADTELPVRVPGTIGLEAHAAWADRRFARTRFGVDLPVAVANGFAPYAPRDHLTAGVGAQWRLPLTRKIGLTASVGADRLLANGASPLVRTRSIVETGLGLVYRFKG